MLPAVLDRLSEQAMVVADSIAEKRRFQGRHAVHETGGKAPKAAIAERRVGLQRPQRVEIDAEIGESRPHRLGQTRDWSRRRSTAGRPETPARDDKPAADPLDSWLGRSEPDGAMRSRVANAAAMNHRGGSRTPCPCRRWRRDGAALRRAKRKPADRDRRGRRHGKRRGR